MSSLIVPVIILLHFSTSLGKGWYGFFDFLTDDPAADRNQTKNSGGLTPITSVAQSQTVAATEIGGEPFKPERTHLTVKSKEKSNLSEDSENSDRRAALAVELQQIQALIRTLDTMQLAQETGLGRPTNYWAAAAATNISKTTSTENNIIQELRQVAKSKLNQLHLKLAKLHAN